MLYDVLIIGAGPAGMTASIYAKRANLKVAIFEKYAPGGQIVNTAEIENYTGYQKTSGYELATHMFNHTQSLGVEVIYEEVTDIKVDGNVKKLVTPNGEYKTKVVIIATGTVPRRLGVENEDMLANRGISWCAICDGPMYKGKEVVVIGGGNSAVEEASYLATLATHVSVIQDMPHLTADKKAQDILTAKPNVDFYFSSKVKKFLVDDAGNMAGVIVTDKDGKDTEVKGNGAFEYIGLIPVTKMLDSLGVTNKFGYVETDEKMATKVPGVYSAGDVNVKQIRQVVTATADGAIAVQNALKYLETWE
ncbi:MAG: FAD-dependent oxidoreductase [Acholeplasma sp.]|nr:FAD-dependent oxidoreductase [Acholeplasma sp.]